ncbi:cadherin-related family member 3-like [Anguilla anguilla]|uniref:cadherin-related family member 3-like n=1 Tax=Anguilla anguilla TaxID=7936 RepID=UPI0015A829BF|nr:cadherin-related family member 3-like [Anguilla anguilla]
MALRQDVRCTPKKKMDCKKLKWVMSLVLGMGLLQDTAAVVSLTGLPGTVELEENSPASTKVFTFEVSFSPGASVASGYPQILNTNPLTRAFIVSMVSASTAQVTVTGTPRLDFEMAPNSFVLQILVVDSAGDAVLGTLTVLLIDVDEAPVFLDEDSVIYTLEKSPPGVIYQPSVSDPENKPLTYALTPSNPAFSVDRDKGSLITKPIDYETDPRSYSFNLTVSDGTHTAVRTLTVLIINANDDKPQFLNKITAFTIPEELNPGHILTNITAVVPSDTFYIGYILYTISTNSYLVIHTYSGVVTIANRMDRDSNPLRDDPTVTVTVTATYSPPGPPLSHSIELTVTVTDINDNPPICSPDVQRRAVTETEALGALITMVTCQDNDVDPVFRKYSFTRLSCLGCNQLFTLSPAGSITLNGSLDFEDPNNLYAGNQYSLLVEAADVNDTFLTGNAYIDVTVTPVNEYPPVFTPSSYFYKISELLGRGAVIGQVNATDRDFPATGITYSFISGGGTSDLSNIFHLDPEHGTISLLTRPDYEATQTYQLVIRAVDGDPVKPLSATAMVIVNITEANDEPPVCGPNNTNLIVPVDLRPGSNVQSFILTCTDKDSPPTSFIYTISGASNLNGHFVFSPAAGTNVTRLILKEPFDFSGGRDTVWKYRLTVLVSDANLMAGEPPPRDQPQTGTVVINVQVFDPDLTTTITTTTTPRITYIAVRENTFDVDDWYVTFICVLAALLLLGILGYLLYLCWKYLSTVDCSCCEPQPVEDKETLVPSVPEKAPIQREIITEITKICTVFDGEAADPVTGRIYEYNTKSGARRWKDDTTESKPEIQLKSSTVVSPEERANPDSTSDTAQLQTTRGTVRSGTGQSQQRSDTNQSNHGSPQPNPRSQSRQQSSQSTTRPRSRDIPMATLEAVDLSEV